MCSKRLFLTALGMVVVQAARPAEGERDLYEPQELSSSGSELDAACGMTGQQDAQGSMRQLRDCTDFVNGFTARAQAGLLESAKNSGEYVKEYRHALKRLKELEDFQAVNTAFQKDHSIATNFLLGQADQIDTAINKLGEQGNKSPSASQTHVAETQVETSMATKKQDVIKEQQQSTDSLEAVYNASAAGMQARALRVGKVETQAALEEQKLRQSMANTVADSARVEQRIEDAEARAIANGNLTLAQNAAEVLRQVEQRTATSIKVGEATEAELRRAEEAAANEKKRAKQLFWVAELRRAEEAAANEKKKAMSTAASAIGDTTRFSSRAAETKQHAETAAIFDLNMNTKDARLGSAADVAKIVADTIKEETQKTRSKSEAMFFVNNTQLRATTNYLALRASKDLLDKLHIGPTWGAMVKGVDEGDGWITIGSHYLPLTINGVQVLTRVRAAEQLHSHQQDLAEMVAEVRKQVLDDAEAARRLSQAVSTNEAASMSPEQGITSSFASMAQKTKQLPALQQVEPLLFQSMYTVEGA